MDTNQFLSTLKIQPDVGVIRGIQQAREYMDGQPNPAKFANNLLKNYDLPTNSNQKKAYLFVMTAVEHALNNQFNIEQIISKANQRLDTITNLIGPGAFYVEEVYDADNENYVHKRTKGSKGEKAKEIFLEFKDTLSEKQIIDKIEEELDVSKQNAYTYLYNVKKKLDLK